MVFIGKTTPSHTRVKSEYTLTASKGYRSGSASPVTPGDNRNPVAKSPATPRTAIQRKSFITRKKLTIGDAKPRLGLGNPAIREIVFEDANEKKNDFLCNPELKVDRETYPNCTFMNICSENVSSWSKFATQLGLLVRGITLLVALTVVIFMVCYTSINIIDWLLVWATGINKEETVESILKDEEPYEQMENDVIDLNPKTFSLTESKHTLSYGDILSMALAGFFRWIINILIPIDG